MNDMEEIVPVAFGWRLPGGEARVKAVFSCALLARDEAKDRWLVQLRELTALTSTAVVPPGIDAMVRSLAGRFAYVPAEVKLGMTLPMKIETLDGRIRYFHATDPRSDPDRVVHGRA